MFDPLLAGEERPGNIPYMPMPEDIALACAEIRETWDAREERTRRTGPNKRIEYKLPGSDKFGIAPGFLSAGDKQNLKEVASTITSSGSSLFARNRPQYKKPQQGDTDE